MQIHKRKERKQEFLSRTIISTNNELRNRAEEPVKLGQLR